MLIGKRKGVCQDFLSPDWLEQKVSRCFSASGRISAADSCIGVAGFGLHSVGFVLRVHREGAGKENLGYR